MQADEEEECPSATTGAHRCSAQKKRSPKSRKKTSSRSSPRPETPIGTSSLRESFRRPDVPPLAPDRPDRHSISTPSSPRPSSRGTRSIENQKTPPPPATVGQPSSAASDALAKAAPPASSNAGDRSGPNGGISINEQAFLSGMEQDARSKKAAAKGVTPAVRPGAVALSGPGSPSGGAEDVIKKRAAHGGAPDAVATDEQAALSIMAADNVAKKRAGRRKKGIPSQPGAVAEGTINARDKEVGLAGMEDIRLKSKIGEGTSGTAGGTMAIVLSMIEEENLMIKGTLRRPVLAPAADEVTADAGQVTEPEYHAGVHTPLESNEEGLAVAVAIEEGEPDLFLPTAIEYDPNAKPPLYKNRRFRLYGALCGLLVLLAVIVGVVVGVVLGGDDGPKTLEPTVSLTLAPTSVEQGAIVRRFIALVGDEVNTTGTPANKASEWILNEDPMNLDESAENLEQRFLLAYFYFFTTQELEWRRCGKPEEGETADCVFDFLEFGYDGSEFYTATPAIRWLSDENECDWIGTLCDAVETVRAIELWGNNITGPLPAMLAKFPFLQSISMAHNDFTGTIPEAYTEMRHLNNLELHYNSLTGTISPNFYKANALQNFNVGGNTLTGTVGGTPDLNLANLEELKGYHIFDNALTGPFPTEIGALKFLSFTHVGGNNFDQQPLPKQLGQLTLLQEMWVDGNRFTGTIPTEIALLEAMTDLRVNNNQLTGPIPEALYELTHMEKLLLEKNQLNGTLSPSIARLIDLQQLRLRENKLTGTIPTELGRLFSLRLAFLHRNLFTGPMPQEVCNNVECDRLQFLNADCGPIDNPAQPCSCCTACCERGVGAEVCLLTNLLDCN